MLKFFINERKESCEGRESTMKKTFYFPKTPFRYLSDHDYQNWFILQHLDAFISNYLTTNSLAYFARIKNAFTDKWFSFSVRYKNNMECYFRSLQR